MNKKPFKNRLDAFQLHLENLQNSFDIGFNIKLNSGNWFTRALRRFISVQAKLELVDMVPLREQAGLPPKTIAQ